MENKIPYWTEDGIYQQDYAEKDIYWWTNGFWSGILWQLYHATQKELYLNTARKNEELLDKALHGFTGLHHDTGFMWLHSAVADYRLTGSQAVSYTHLITKDIESASIDRLRYTSFNIQRQKEIADQLLGWITYNRQLQNILTSDYSKIYEKQLDIIQFSSYAMEYAVNANIESNIFKILILEDNGSSFQIGNGMSLLDEKAIRDAKWAETYEPVSYTHLDVYKRQGFQIVRPFY